MVFLKDWLINFFTLQPFPQAAIQFASRYVSGIHVAGREGKVRNHFILSLEKGTIQPSFDRKNINNPALLEKKLREGLNTLLLSGRKVACLIPELSVKGFVFSFKSLPSSWPEREQIIRFRIKKQIPLLPGDTRCAFDVMKTNSSTKVYASVVRSSVVREYEDLLGKFRLTTVTVGVPTFCLYNLLNMEKARDALFVNIEEDTVSLLGVINSEVILYRQKPFLVEARAGASAAQKMESVVKEVENTVHFIEDREERKVRSFYVRLGLLEDGEILSLLREKSPFPLTGIESELTSPLGSKEKKILSPLIGQILR